MNKNEIELLEELEKTYFNATCVCDPIEYQNRQKNLLYHISEVILDPLKQYRISIKNNNEGSAI